MKKLLSVLLAASVSVSIFAANWVSDLPDNMRVCTMSIPGAHDAATSEFSGLISSGKCQSKNLAGLWDAGIRAFDLRPALNGSSLHIYHGPNKTKTSMADALNTLKSKLEENPGEIAVILMRHETEGDDNAAGWADAMKSLFDGYSDIIAEFNPDMRLADARGKIIVLCRDNFSSAKAGFVSGWGDKQAYNTSARITRGSVSASLYVQDLYKADNNAAKSSAITGMLDYSTNNSQSPVWVVNHTSGYVGVGLNLDIQSNAKNANKTMLDYLNDSSKGQGRTGIVLMDYAADNSSYCGLDLTNAIIARNSVEVTVSTDELTAFFNDRLNWYAGPAAKSVGTTNKYSTQIIESYRDDALATGRVMYTECAGVPDGDYVVTLMAHANWTPDRGSIKTAQALDGAKGYSQLSVNNSVVDLPVIHNTGFPAQPHIYSVPVTVADGTLTIAFDNIRKGANWFTCHVLSINPLFSDNFMTQDFQNDYVGWTETTKAQNHTLKNGSSDLSPTTSYENWNPSPYTGRMYTAMVVPNGTYEVSLDVFANAVDGDNIAFFANDSRSTVTTARKTERHSLTVEVSDHNLVFGVDFASAVVNWAGVDNASVKLVRLEDEATFHTMYSNPAYFFDYPANWTKGEAFSGGNLQHKDNLFVETWRGSAARPSGTIMTSTQSDLRNGSYMVALYAFANFTGSEPEFTDGEYGRATLTVNGTDVAMPVYNNGNVPALHELYHIPAEITDGTLTISFNGNAYPNWFLIDVVDIVEASDIPVELPMPVASNSLPHGKNIFNSDMSAEIQNNKVKDSDSGISPNESFHENWNGSTFTGRLYHRVYVPAGTYTLSLDCFAQNIGDDLDAYYLFANEAKAAKTQANAFETLTVEIGVGAPDTQAFRAPAANTVYPLEYGLAIDRPVSQWVGVKNPRLVRSSSEVTGVDNIAVDNASSADKRVYNLAGVCVASDPEAARDLAPGVYISAGRKFMVR